MSRTDHHVSRGRLTDAPPVHHWEWWCKEPKWWRKMFKHRKRRAEWRHLLPRVLSDSEDVPMPLDKKPWIYY